MLAIGKNPIVVSSWRLLETSVIVSSLAFLATLQQALASPGGIASYNWHSAVVALGLGVASGLVNAIVTGLNIYLQSLNTSGQPPQKAP